MSTKTVLFPSSPVIQSVRFDESDGDMWQLKRDYFDPNTGILIRKGFVFDGASIPRFFWRYIGHPMTGCYVAPSVLHDAKYASQYGTRSDADTEFREDLKTCGVGLWKRWLMYFAVRLFGGSAWRYYDEQAVEWVRDLVELKGEGNV